jgi:hypothetical protein
MGFFRNGRPVPLGWGHEGSGQGKRFFIIANSTSIALTPLLLCRLQLTLQTAFVMTSFVFYTSILTVNHRF